MLLLADRYALSSGRSLDHSERGNEVFDDVIGMFQPAREPHQTVADAELRAGGGCEALVRRGRRMRDQALGVAEIVADFDELERILKTERAGLAAGHLECDQSRTRPHLLLRERGLRMIGAAWIKQARHFGVLG